MFVFQNTHTGICHSNAIYFLFLSNQLENMASPVKPARSKTQNRTARLENQKLSRMFN